MSAEPTPIWTPSPERVAHCRLTRYLRWLDDTHGRRFDGYEPLWQWSVTDLEGFWSSVWDFCGMKSHSAYTTVLAHSEMPGAQWFPGATLNYAEHLLAQASHPDAAARPAIVFQSELVARQEIGWAELAAQTGALTATLRRLGVGKGDRVVAYMPNIPQTIVALLAVASIGAIWSSSSPEMGPVSVLDRQQAILLGQFSRYRLADNDRGFDLPAVVRWLRAQTRTPVLTGLPFGHEHPKLTLPHGAQVALATEGRTCYLVLQEHDHDHDHHDHER